MMQPAFVDSASAAAMVTVRADGTPHVARCAIGLVDGRLLSTVLPDAVRVRHVRRENRATLFLYDPASPGNARKWLAVDAAVTLHEGPAAAALCLALRKVVQARLDPPPPEGKVAWAGALMSETEFLAAVSAEDRLVFEFEPLRSYGEA